MLGKHDRYSDDVAPYAIGALAPPEAEALEQHLLGCGRCQRELAELRSGAEVLSRSVEQLEPPASLRVRILADLTAAPSSAADPSADSKRSAPAAALAAPAGGPRPAGPGGPRPLARLRARVLPSPSPGSARLFQRAGLALAIGLVALVAGVAGWELGGGGASAPEDRTVAASVDRKRLPGASAEMIIPAKGSDPVLRLAGLRSLDAQRTYEIWVQRDGELAPGPLFSPTADGAAVTGIPGKAEDIEAVFVTRERAGGALTPSETPIVSVPLRS
jgi:hypothetical protein